MIFISKYHFDQFVRSQRAVDIVKLFLVFNLYLYGGASIVAFAARTRGDVVRLRVGGVEADGVQYRLLELGMHRAHYFQWEGAGKFDEDVLFLFGHDVLPCRVRYAV